MAATISTSGSITLFGNNQLFRTSSGVPYFITWLNNETLVFKGNSANPTSFSEVDSSNRLTTANDARGAIDSTDKIHVVQLVDGGKSSSFRHFIFDTSTDTWDSTTGEQITTVDIADLTSPYYCNIAIDSNDIPHVTIPYAYNSMGTPMSGNQYTNRVGGSWKTPIEISTSLAYVIHIDSTNIPIISAGDNLYRGDANNATTFTGAGLASGANNLTITNLVSTSSGYFYYVTIDSSLDRIRWRSLTNLSNWTNSGSWQNTSYNLGAANWLSNSVAVIAIGDDVHIYYYNYNNGNITSAILNGTTITDPMTDTSLTTSGYLGFQLAHDYRNFYDASGTDRSSANVNLPEISFVTKQSNSTFEFETISLSNGNVTTTPTTEDIAINLQAPTITIAQNTTTTQTAEDISIDLQAPTISTTTNTTYQVGFMTVPIDPLLANVITTVGAITTPTTEDIAEALLQPTVSTTSNANPTHTEENFVFALNNVTVATTTNVTATTTLIDFVFALNTPTVSNATNTTVLPDAIGFAFTEQPPTVSGDALTPAMGDALTLDLFVPTINTQVFATATAGQQDISITEQNPTVSTVSNVSNTPTNEDLLFEVLSVTIATSINITTTLDLIDLPISQEAPNINTGVGVIPTPEDFSFNLLTVLTGSSVFPNGDLLGFVINQEAPSVQAVQNVSVSEEFEDIIIEALTATASTTANTTTSPTTEDIVFDLYNVSVSVNKSVQPTTEDIVFVTNAATAGQFTTIVTEPTEEGFTIAQQQPSVSTEVFLDLIDLDFFINDQSPVVKISKTVNVDLSDEVIGVENVSVTGSANVLPSTVGISETILNATVNSGLLIGTNTTPLIIEVLQATALFTKTVTTTPTTEDATIDLFGVSIATTTNKTVTTTSEDIVVDLLNVSVFHGSTIQPSEIDLQEEVQTPSVSTIKSPVVAVDVIDTILNAIKPLTGVVFIESQDLQVDNLNVTIETSANFISTNPYSPNATSYAVYLFDYYTLTLYNVIATGNARFLQIEESIPFEVDLLTPSIQAIIGVDAFVEIQSDISFSLELFDAKGITKEVEINAYELTAISPVITTTTIVIINNTIRFGRYEPPIPFNFDLFDVSIIAQPVSVVVSVSNIDFTLSTETATGSLVENAIAYVNRLQFSVNDPTPYEYIAGYNNPTTPIYKTHYGAIVMTEVEYYTYNGGPDVTILLGDTGNFPNGWPFVGFFLAYPYTIIFDMDPLLYHLVNIRPQDCLVITEQNVNPFQDVIGLSIDLFSVTVSTTSNTSVSVDLLDTEVEINNLEGVNLGTTTPTTEDDLTINIIAPNISTATNIALSVDENNVVVGDFDVMISASSIIDLNKIEFNLWQIYPDSPKTNYQVEVAKYNALITTIRNVENAQVTTTTNAKAVVTKEISFKSKIEC